MTESPPSDPSAALDPIVVLVEPHHPGNIGSTARAMANMGARTLRLVNPCKLTKEAYYMAWNAVELVESAEIFDSLQAAIADCRMVYGFSARRGRHRTGPRHLPRVAEDASNQPGPVALVFGREDAGLRIEEYELCHALVRIPTRGTSTSLNLSQAVMVALYELMARPSAAVPSDGRGRSRTRYLWDLDDEPTTEEPEEGAARIDVELFEKLLLEWDGAARALGYDTFGPKDLMRRLMRRFRRILVRAHLNQDDADLLFGVARRIRGTYRVPGSRQSP